MIIAGNKCDKHDSQVTDEDMQLLEEKTGVKCYFTSALTGENIETAFMQLIAVIVAQKKKQGRTSIVIKSQVNNNAPANADKR